MADKTFLRRLFILLSLAFLTHFSLQTLFNGSGYWRFIAFFPSIGFLVAVFWFYQNRNEFVRILNSAGSEENTFKFLITEVRKIGLLNYKPVGTFLIILTIGTEIESLLNFDLYVFTAASNTLINLTYLVYIYLIFYPRPEDVELND